MTTNEDKDNKLVESVFNDLLNSIEYKTDDADQKLIRRAF